MEEKEKKSEISGKVEDEKKISETEPRCCYFVDPCEFFVDPCGCYVNPCRCC
ncbi:MAG: hypothetical protein R6U27_13385 [Desulfobacterales bacterium]